MFNNHGTTLQMNMIDDCKDCLITILNKKKRFSQINKQNINKHRTNYKYIRNTVKIGLVSIVG